MSPINTWSGGGCVLGSGDAFARSRLGNCYDAPPLFSAQRSKLWRRKKRKRSTGKLDRVHTHAAGVDVGATFNVPGRKTDVNDAQWLQQLHEHGLLRGSFRPREDIA